MFKPSIVSARHYALRCGKKMHLFIFLITVKPRSMLVIFGLRIPYSISHLLHPSCSLYTQAQRTSLIFFLFTW